MGNKLMSVRAAAAESFDYDEIAGVDSDFISIRRSMCATNASTRALVPAVKVITGVPADLSLSSSSDYSNRLSMKPTMPAMTPFAWLSWAISNYRSLIIQQKTQATAVEETQNRQHHHQQIKTPTSESQASFEIQTPAIETNNTGIDEDDHQLPVVQHAEHLPLVNAKANLEDVISDTESESSGSDLPVCDNNDDSDHSATMFAMVHDFLRKPPSSSSSTGSYATSLDANDGDGRVSMAGFSSANTLDVKVFDALTATYSAWRRESLHGTTSCKSVARFSQDESTANICSA